MLIRSHRETLLMRFLFKIALILGAILSQLNTYGAYETCDLCSIMFEVNETPSSPSIEEMLSSLSKEFKCSFSVHTTAKNKIQLISSEGRLSVDWWISPEKVFESEDLNLFKTRFYNAGRGLSAYYLLIEGIEYRLYLRDKTASLTTAFIIPDAHLKLIKVWILTFKDPPITNFLLKEMP